MNKYHLTPFHQDFIRENYQSMHDSEIAEVLGIKAYHILQFRNENGLVKKAPNELRKFEGKGKWFKVNEISNWLA